MKSRPDRIDFLLFSINDAEDKAIEKIFQLRNDFDESGLRYTWGNIETDAGIIVCVSHVSLNDHQGEVKAYEKAQSVMEILEPNYILLLGIAGGIHKKEKIEEGDVFVSSMVRYGPIKTSSYIRELPLQQPDGDLRDFAEWMAKRKTWRHELNKQITAFSLRVIEHYDPEGNDEIAKVNPVVYINELVSTDVLMKDIRKDDNLTQIMTQHPRAVAVDMEAGGIAKCLHEQSSKGRNAGYLVIKGISDVADREGHENDSEEAQEKRRKRWQTFAALASTLFAINLIKEFVPANHSPSAIRRFLPETDFKYNEDCAGVLYDVHPSVYSEIAADNLTRLIERHPSENNVFFTVCAFDPKSLWELAIQRYRSDRPNKWPSDLQELKAWTLSKFPHFEVFERNRNKGIRILLLDDFTKWTDEENLKPYYWEFFKIVSGEVPLWGIDRVTLHKISKYKNLFWTDYVILGEQILLDYYDNSSILIISHLRTKKHRDFFMHLTKLFRQEKHVFKKMVDLDKEAKIAFQKVTRKLSIGKSHLYWGFKYVGFFKSIRSQRIIQSNLLKKCSSTFSGDRTFLSVGTAFGEELACFAQEGALESWSTIVGIDIDGDVKEQIMAQPTLTPYSERLSFVEMDLLNLPGLFGEKYWACIQCGFVLEDIDYDNKQTAYDNLFRALNDQGFLIISEMFVDNQKKSDETDELRKQQITELYNHFLEEAKDCRDRKQLTLDQYNLLCGDGKEPGLLLTRKMAIEGARDYFETREQIENRLITAGFSSIDYHPNPDSPLLGVIVARKGA